MPNLTIIPREYNHTTIGQRQDGYLNATAMCKANGKEWSNYRQTQMADEFIEALERSLGIPRDVLVVVVSSGHNAGRGTWVHPQIGYHLAMWCNPDFAVKVTDWISDIRTHGFTTAEGIASDRQKAEKVAASRVAPVFRDFMAIGKMIGLAGNQQIIHANRAAARLTGINALEAMGANKLIEASQEASYPVRDIAARMGVKSSQALNKMLEEMGFQVCRPTENPRWEPTEAGKPFAELITVDPTHGYGKSKQMWQWRLGIIDKLSNNDNTAAA